MHRLTGEKREVDVVVRATVGEHPLVISLECIDRSRRADVTWVEQMKCIHDHLETNKLVLVSRSGFSKQALTLARKLGIQTYTPDEACAEDWTQVVGQASLLCARHDYTPVATSLRVDPGDGVRIVEVGPDTEFFRPDSNVTGKLRDLVLFVLNDPAFDTVAMDSHKADGSAIMEFDLTLDHPTYATDPYGKRHLILGVHVKVRAVRRTSEVPMTSLRWRGVPAAFGAAKTDLGPTTLTFVEAARGKISTKVLVDGKEVPTYRHCEEGVPGNVRFGTG